jgi:hypothetical protein
MVVGNGSVMDSDGVIPIDRGNRDFNRNSKGESRMSAKIHYGNAKLKERVERRSPEDKNVYINLDAIAELPDEYEAIISEVLFDPKDLPASFSDVGVGAWMPGTALIYEIAEACGISGIGEPIIEPIIEEIDYNPMLCAPMDALPTKRKMIVGKRVSKQSQVMQEDGTMRASSVCTSDYNAWERCSEAWSKEEMYTNGYTKEGKFPPKYDNKYKRKHHFDEEMKFAHAKAETKSHIKTIRELAKMQTGFKTEDLKEGRLIFVKIRRSSMVLKLETAARLDAIRNGGPHPTLTPAQMAEFEAPGAKAIAEAKRNDDLILTPDPEPLTEREQMHKDLTEWLASKLIPLHLKELGDVKDDLPKYTGKLLAFLEMTDCEKQIDKWKKVQRVHNAIKGTIPAGVLNTKPEKEDIF